MITIFKYEINVEDRQVVEMPFGAEILNINVQYGKVFMWALVDTNETVIKKNFVVYGTGNPINSLAMKKYVGSFQLLEGKFVGHVFELL